MKFPACVLSLLLLASPGASADEYLTSKGVRHLPPFPGLTRENDLLQARREAESILSDLLAESVALDQEGLALMKELASLEQAQKDEQAALDKVTAEFAETQKKYLEQLALHEERKAAHEADAQRQRDEYAQLNTVPSAQQDRATVERLQAWAREIDARKLTLDAERNALLTEHDAVETKRLAAVKSETDAGARLRAKRDEIQARSVARQSSHARLYAQIKQAAAYLTQVDSSLQTKFKSREPRSPLLDRARQRLRQLEAQ